MDVWTIIDYVLNIAVTVINIFGICVVILGFIVAATSFVRMRLHKHSEPNFFLESNKVRAVLGTYILFGLEFMIAGDIIHTFLKPTHEDLLVLGTIVVIRTVISYFLGREVNEARHEQAG